MKKGYVAAIFVWALILASASFVYADSAEDMLTRQSPGVTYIVSGNDITESVTIRGDEVTLRSNGCAGGSECPPVSGRIIRKYTEGNKLIFETDHSALAKLVVDGAHLLIYVRYTSDNQLHAKGYTYKRQ